MFVSSVRRVRSGDGKMDDDAHYEMGAEPWADAAALGALGGRRKGKRRQEADRGGVRESQRMQCRLVPQ